MLTTYQIKQRIEDFSTLSESELMAKYNKNKKQCASLLHYYKKGKPAQKRIDHATPAHKKVVSLPVAPIARNEVHGGTHTKPLDKVTRVLVGMAVVCFIVLVIRNIFF